MKDRFCRGKTAHMSPYNASQAQVDNAYSHVRGYDDVSLAYANTLHQDPISDTLNERNVGEHLLEETQADGNLLRAVSSISPPPSDANFTEVQNISELQNTPRKRSAIMLGDWIWEFSAAVFSIGCLTAAIIVLTIYDNKSLTSWNFVFDANPNTVIAILSTLSRTALLVPVASCISQLKWIHLAISPRQLRDVQTYEDASRGPWGALGLIWKLNIRSKLATWGSFITILTLAMGPFAQQLISYPNRLIYAPQATFYAAQVYDSGTSRGLTATWSRGIKKLFSWSDQGTY
jgi:hypothetical protein